MHDLAYHVTYFQNALIDMENVKAHYHNRNTRLHNQLTQETIEMKQNIVLNTIWPIHIKYHMTYTHQYKECLEKG